jgi:hypothetical protein
MSDYTSCADAGRSIASPSLRRSNTSRRGTSCLAACLLCGALSAPGCGGSEGTGFAVNVKAQGALVSVDAGQTSSGFARGVTRAVQETKAFKISQFPITVQEYQACQVARACGAPKVDECSDPALANASFGNGVAGNVAVCVGRENAQSYCKWVGGRLPTLAEWLRAARGSGVQKYPWGSRRATCAQHPRSIEGDPEMQRYATQPLATDGCAATAEAGLVTGLHPAGASLATGMQDILITPAELLEGDAQSPYASCGPGMHCLVYGWTAGSIDSVKPYAVGGMYAASAEDVPRFLATPQAYGFRCVVEK